MVDVRFMVLAVVAIASACGGRIAANDADAGSGSANDASAQGSRDCPSAPPTGGSACAREALACEYGSDVDPACNTVAICTMGAWSIAPTRRCAPPAPQKICDAALGPPSASQCSTPGAACQASGDGAYVRCACVAMGDALSYQCLLSSTDPACVYPRPLLGTHCSTDGVVCDYGACFAIPGGARLRCTEGAWTLETAVSCP